MSYDIRLAVKTEFGGFVVIDKPQYDSPTYNLGELFQKCTKWDFKQGEYYNCEEVLPLVRGGLRELNSHPEKYEKYLPSNGWGTMKDARDCLEYIVKCIEDNITDYDRIPAQFLYIKW